MSQTRNPRLLTTGAAGSRPSPGFRFRRGDRGFTLIEMLLAVAICAIVLVAINGVFATAIRLRDKTSETIEKALPLNRALDVLCRDLKGAVGPGGFLAGDFKCGVQATGATMGLSGEAGSTGLDFYTSTGAISYQAPWGDLQEVFYELKAPSDQNQTGMDLVRCVNRNLLAMTTQTPEIQRLMGNVQTLEFDCYDGSQWRNTWDTSSTDTNLPLVVRVRIQLAPPPGEAASHVQPVEMIVPLVSQPVSESLAGATSEEEP
jgi:type II secretion system protein J